MAQATIYNIPNATDDATITSAAVGDRLKQSLAAVLSSHEGATRPTYAVAGLVWRNDTTGILSLWDGTSDLPIAVFNAAVPASATDTGTAGQLAIDATHLYYCTATDTWVRVALATW